MGFGDLRVIEEQNKKASMGMSGNTKGGISGIPGQYPTKPATTKPAKTATTPTTTTQASGDWYDVNNVSRPTTITDEKENPIPTPSNNQPQIIYREPEFDPTEYINQLKAAAKTEGPVESPSLEDDSENDDEVIE